MKAHGLSTYTVFANARISRRLNYASCSFFSFQGGQNLFLYVTVSDGQLTAKTEVYVNIKNASAPNRGKTRCVLTHMYTMAFSAVFVQTY